MPEAMHPNPERSLLGAGPLRPLRLAVFGACLAFGLHVAMEPRDLDPREPWIAAEEGLPGAGHIALDVVTAGEAVQAAQGQWVAFEEAQAFVDLSLDAMAEVAERLNVLRRIGTAARHAPDADQFALELEFERELLRLEGWAAGVRLGDVTPLAPMGPIAVACQPDHGRAVRFVLAGWDRDALGISATPLVDPTSIEATLAALDRAYYRVVAQYREMARLETLLLQRARDVSAQ